MKKIFLIVGLVALALAIVGVGGVFAQAGQPGMMQGSHGWMHEYIQQAFAAKLGLTEQQVQEQFAAGKMMYQIALDNGVNQEDLANFMNEVHQEAFAQAVKDGVVTQERADWMLQRMQYMFQNGTDASNCPMHNGQSTSFGQGRGMMGGTGMMNGSGMMGWTWGQGAQNP